MLRFILTRIVRWVPSAVLFLFIVYALAFYGAGDPIWIMFLREGGMSCTTRLALRRSATRPG